MGLLRRWWTLFFGAHVEFRVKLLNAVLIVGLACCPPTVVANYTAAGGGGVAAAVMPLIMMALCLATLWYVTKTGRHLVGYLMVVVALAAANIALFFIGGGYNHATQILNFMFGILLAAIMLRGRLMIVFCALQFILYTACIVIEYRFPETVTVPYTTETDKVFDIMASLFTLSAMLTVVLGLFFRLYDRQARELEAAREQAEAAHRGSADNDAIIVTVEDDGRGIPPDLLPRIFEKGVSGAGSSGLGLSVCKDIARWHGGDISIDSEAGKGASVTVTLRRDA